MKLNGFMLSLGHRLFYTPIDNVWLRTFFIYGHYHVFYRNRQESDIKYVDTVCFI